MDDGTQQIDDVGPEEEPAPPHPARRGAAGPTRPASEPPPAPPVRLLPLRFRTRRGPRDAEGPAEAGRRSGAWAARGVRALRAAVPALAGYLVVRIVGLAVALAWSRTWHRPFVGRLVAWDSGWYEHIAAFGYDAVLHHRAHRLLPSNLAFFPLYPALMRALRTVLPFLGWAQIALVVANLAALAAAWGIFAVAERLHGRRIAVLAAVLWGCWPVAIVQNMAYSEALLTACAAWALWCAVSGRWIAAGVWACLAGLARPNGIAAAAGVIAGAALTLGLRAVAVARADTAGGGSAASDTAASGSAASGSAVSDTSGRRPAWWRPVVGAVLAPLGWIGYILWVGHRVHDSRAYFTVQRAWRSRFDFGRSTWDQIATVFSNGHTFSLGVGAVTLLIIGSAVLLLVTALDRQPLPLWAYSATLLVIAVGDTAYFVSRARFLLPAFPLLLPIAAALARVRTRAVRGLLIAVAAGLSAVFGGYLLYVWPHAP